MPTADRRAALALCAVLALGAVACGAGDGDDPAGPGAEPFALGLEVGDCFDRPDDPDVTSVPSVPCRRPHDLEVFAVLELPDGAYPGPSVVAQRAGTRCSGRFEGYVGAPPDSSGLVIVPYTPDRLAWDAGERAVTCAVSLAEGRSEGSVRASEVPRGEDGGRRSRGRARAHRRRRLHRPR